MSLRVVLYALLLPFATPLQAQIFQNPSLEGQPMYAVVPPYWETDLTDCGGYSTPDIQPGYWDTYLPPHHGNSYIGMVARENQTAEGIYQHLTTPLKIKNCYSFTIHLAKAPQYELHPNPGVLEIWGGNTKCERRQLLWSSPPIAHTNWQPYDVSFLADGDWQNIAFLIKGRASNMLIDDISNETARPFEILLTGLEDICEGESVVLSATGPENTSLQWSTGEVGTAITVTSAGTYSAQATHAGCSTTATHDVRPLFFSSIDLGPDTVTMYANSPFYEIIPDNPLQLPVLWNTGEQSETITVSASGFYSASVSNRCGAAQDGVYVQFIPLFIPNVVTRNSDNKNDKFYVQGFAPGSIELTICNRWGELVFQTDSYADNWPESETPAGIYYFIIRSKVSLETFKEVVHVIGE
jgi:hypothetical protein